MRKKRAEKRYAVPDPRFNDVMVSRFINKVMIQGKKNTARILVYSAFDIIADKMKQDPIEVFRKALSNVSPAIEVRSRRVGGADRLHLAPWMVAVGVVRYREGLEEVVVDLPGVRPPRRHRQLRQ